MSTRQQPSPAQLDYETLLAICVHLASVRDISTHTTTFQLDEMRIIFTALTDILHSDKFQIDQVWQAVFAQPVSVASRPQKTDDLVDAVLLYETQNNISHIEDYELDVLIEVTVRDYIAWLASSANRSRGKSETQFFFDKKHIGKRLYVAEGVLVFEDQMWWYQGINDWDVLADGTISGLSEDRRHVAMENGRRFDNPERQRMNKVSRKRDVLNAMHILL